MIQTVKGATLNVQAMIEEIYKDDVSKMYDVISELEDNERYGEVPDNYEELNMYLSGYIENIHVKICTILDFYKLDFLKEQYLKEYNSMSNTEIELFCEVDVVDSPIYGKMNKYLSSLKYIVIPGDSSMIKIDNHNYLKSDISNKNEVKIENSYEELIEKLEKISLVNEEKNNQFISLIEELKNNPKEKKSIIVKIKDFIVNAGLEHFNDEIKSEIPKLVELLMSVSL